MILRISDTALQAPCIHLPTSTVSARTATPTPMVDESMADEFKAEESKADENNSMAHGMAYISYEILKYRGKRNACNLIGGEIFKYWRKRST